VLFIALACFWAPLMAEDRPTVVVTFSVLADFARVLAGDDADVVNLVPRGAEVHEYELRPADFKALEHADLVFYNGLSLEQWLPQVRSVVPKSVPIIGVVEAGGVKTLPILSGEYQGQPDPHAWMDPMRAALYVSAMAEQLASVLPEQATAIQARAERYQAQLVQLQSDLLENFSAIPARRRVLISSEAAFVYFAEAFDFFHAAIWGNNAEAEGGPRQLMRVVDIIAQRQPPALFWESTVSSRSVETVSTETGVPYFGPLFVDSLGEPGSSAATYLGMMRANASLLAQALAGER
jgi:manganese/iron transport system substrate-binding protein